MKKHLKFFLLLLSLFMIFTSCKNIGKDSLNEKNTTENKFDSGQAHDTYSTKNKPASQYGNPKKDLKIDIDLTKLDSHEAHEEFSNILTRPEKYLGKVIKISGQYYASFYEPNQKYYHFIVIFDTHSFHEEELEFVMQGDYTYPDDYPEDATEIEIIGVLESYQEEGEIWYRLNTEGIRVISH